MLKEPLSPTEAKRLIVRALEAGKIEFGQPHAQQEMDADALTMRDVARALRGGVVEPAELRGGSYRYRVRASWAYVVVAFRGEDRAVVVTAWRNR